LRLFTAVDPSDQVHQRLVTLLDRLRPTARLRWTKPENLHLTLKFIGEYPDSDLARLEEALRGVEWQSFPVRMQGLGFFPHARAPRVFWVGVEAGTELGALAGRIDQALVELGVPAERRPYSPHLTLARIDGQAPLSRLHRTIQDLDSVEFGAFQPDCFSLYKSQPGPGGSVYTRIRDFGTTS
jgi:2'-5' RNA ligase